jgi:hypothetical protein
MANPCQCGCGELLPEGSTRQFKRGHKANPGGIPNEGFSEISADDVLTIDDVAASTPDDPDPVDTETKPKITHRVTAAMRKDIEGKLALGFGLIGQSWMMIDPLCGKMMVDTGPDMAKAYTPLLCQSPEVVKWLTKSGNWMLWVNAVMATAPLLQMIFAHHLARTITVDRLSTPNGYVSNPEDYVVQ